MLSPLLRSRIVDRAVFTGLRVEYSYRYAYIDSYQILDRVPGLQTLTSYDRTVNRYRKSFGPGS